MLETEDVEASVKKSLDKFVTLSDIETLYFLDPSSNCHAGLDPKGP